MLHELSSGLKVNLWFEHKKVDGVCEEVSRPVSHVTVCHLEIPSLLINVQECAYCVPPDQFRKEQGRKISLRKVLNKVYLSLEERKCLWAIALPKRVKCPST